MLKNKTVTMLLVVLAVSSCLLVLPAGAANNNPNKIHGSPTYVLNILGKKSDWNAQGDFDNPDRHTIFVPENTAEWGEIKGTDGVVRIWMTSGPEFAVLDGNALDDGNASLQIESGRYYVYFVALAKPGGDGHLSGWYYDDEGNAYLPLGLPLQVRRSKGQPIWTNATDLFYIEWDQVVATLLGMGLTTEQIAALLASYGYVPGDHVWIFDFLTILQSLGDTDYYFWQLDNNGNKHIQVRFYN